MAMRKPHRTTVYFDAGTANHFAVMEKRKRPARVTPYDQGAPVRIQIMTPSGETPKMPAMPMRLSKNLVTTSLRLIKVRIAINNLGRVGKSRAYNSVAGESVAIRTEISQVDLDSTGYGWPSC